MALHCFFVFFAENGLILANAVTAFFFLHQIFDSAFFLLILADYFFYPFFDFFFEKEALPSIGFFWFFEKEWLPSASFKNKNGRFHTRVFQDVPWMQPKEKNLKKKINFFSRFFFDLFWKMTNFGLILGNVPTYFRKSTKNRLILG